MCVEETEMRRPFISMIFNNAMSAVQDRPGDQGSHNQEWSAFGYIMTLVAQQALQSMKGFDWETGLVIMARLFMLYFFSGIQPYILSMIYRRPISLPLSSIHHLDV